MEEHSNSTVVSLPSQDMGGNTGLDSTIAQHRLPGGIADARASTAHTTCLLAAICDVRFATPGAASCLRMVWTRFESRCATNGGSIGVTNDDEQKQKRANQARDGERTCNRTEGLAESEMSPAVIIFLVGLSINAAVPSLPRRARCAAGPLGTGGAVTPRGLLVR
jgi:hypothetical protein